MATTPHYKHDCDNCVLLGQDERYDFYWCYQGGVPTVIARASDDESDYESGMIVGEQGFYPLAKAYNLAYKFGYSTKVRTRPSEFTREEVDNALDEVFSQYD